MDFTVYPSVHHLLLGPDTFCLNTSDYLVFCVYNTGDPKADIEELPYSSDISIVGSTMSSGHKVEVLCVTELGQWSSTVPTL